MKAVFLLFSFSNKPSVFGQTSTASDCVDAVNICTNATFAIDPNGEGAVLVDGNNVSNPTTNLDREILVSFGRRTEQYMDGD